MPWIASHFIALLSYGFLYLSVVLLWLPGNRKIPRWVSSLTVSIILGLLSHQLEMKAIIGIGLLAAFVYLGTAKKVNNTIHIAANIGTFFLAYAFIKHYIPGFNRLLVLDKVHFGHDAFPFSLNLDFSKTLAGIFILGFTCQLISRKSEWASLFKQLARIAPPVILVVIAMSFRLHFVTFDFKLSENIIIWAVVNLLCVSVAEEAFYRGFVQEKLSLMMGNVKYGNYFAVGLAGIMFGLDHFPSSDSYILLATIAGIGYGWIYLVTKRIEGSILTHFGLNLIHFVFFTYPMLVTAVSLI